MSTSFYFNNFNNSQEQVLIENLVLESIKIYGHDVFYCPRTLVAKDDIYGEDALSEYNTAYMIDMYIRSYDSYGGDGQFLSKFNLEIRDTVTFTVSVRNFQDEVGSIENITRPREGDLIYLPMADRILVIKYVNKTPIFYQMGSIQMYDLSCEMFEYSSEKFNTGIAAIDQIEVDNNADLTDYVTVDANGNVIEGASANTVFQSQIGDAYEDNIEFQTAGNSILDWSQTDPFSEGNV